MTMCEYVETSATRTESLVSRLFDTIPEDSVMVVLASRKGKFWVSHPQEVEDLNIEPGQWQTIMERLDDGDDPVVVSSNDVHIIGSQLSSRQCEYPYVMILLARKSADTLVQNMDLVQMVINQIDLMMEYADCELACL